MVAPTVLDREVTDLTVANTTVETDIFNHSIPGNTIGTEGVVRAVIVGDMLKNNVVGETLTVRVYLGATTLFDDVIGAAIPISASRRPFMMEFWLANQNATNDQHGGGYVLLGTAGGATTGIGNFNTDEIGTNASIVGVASAIDTTVAAVFRVSVQWSVASANNSFIRLFGLLIRY